MASTKPLSKDERSELDRFLSGTNVTPLVTSGTTGQRIGYEQRRLTGLLGILGVQADSTLYADLTSGVPAGRKAKGLRERLSSARARYERQTLDFYRTKQSQTVSDYFKNNDTAPRTFPTTGSASLSPSPSKSTSAPSGVLLVLAAVVAGYFLLRR